MPHLIWQPPHHPWWPGWNHERWSRESPGCLHSGSAYLLEGHGLSWTSQPRHADRLDCLHGKLYSCLAEIGSSANRCLPGKTLGIPSTPKYGKTKPSTCQWVDAKHAHWTNLVVVSAVSNIIVVLLHSCQCHLCRTRHVESTPPVFGAGPLGFGGIG